MGSLSGRTCLITGASSGFGAHFARLAAGAGAKLVVGARRVERVQALADELGNALAVAMDVTDEASIAAAFDAGEAAFGTIDTVIANAGVSAPGRSTEIPADTLRGLLETNVLGAFLTAREGAKRMILAGSRDTGPMAGRGRILLIGSMGAEVPVKGEVMYGASKAAVAKMGRDLAGEWVRSGINVNVLQPGFILTEMAAEWFASDGGKAQIAGFPRRRLQPIESLDAMVLHLCSDASAAMTGSVITIDDGQSL